MHKKVIQDMVPKKKKNFVPIKRTLESSSSKKEKSSDGIDLDEFDFFSKSHGSNKTTQKTTGSNKKGLKKIALFSLGGILVVIFLFWFSTFFTVVDIKIEPTQLPISIDDLFLAGSVSGGELSFQTMSLSDEETLSIPLTETKTVESRASGEITIYNEFSQSPQQLIARTRFQSPEGKIYRIEKPVTIPGGTLSAGKIVPGKIVVTVSADESGEEYNIGPSDFTIPGFKDTDRFSKIYARSSDSIGGGFLGEIKTASDDSFDSAKLSLEKKLNDKLTQRAMAEVPPGFVLFKDAFFISSEDNKNDLATNLGESFEYKITAELISVIIDREELEEMIIRKSIRDIKPEEIKNIDILNLETMSMNFIGKSSVNPRELSSFSFRLTGSGVALWKFNETTLKEMLLGVKKGEHQNIFRQFPVIEKAEATLRPYWSRTFPSNPEKIRIELIINS